MPKLNDTQLVILAAAAQRDDRLVLPLPTSLKLDEKQAARTLSGLIRKKLIAARPATGEEPVWRKGEDGERQTLVLTDAGLAAIGCLVEASDEVGDATPATGTARKTGKPAAAKSRTASKGTSKKQSSGKAGPKSGRRKDETRSTKSAASTTGKSTDAKRPTKVDEILALLQRREGAAIAEMTTATGWQPHSVRAAMTGLRKRGVTVTREKQGGITRYRAAAR